MRAVLALLLLGGAGAVAFLIFAESGSRGPAAPPPRALPQSPAAARPRTQPGPSRIVVAPRAPAAPAAPTSTPTRAQTDFDARFEERVSDGRKNAIRELLADWRTGRLSPEQDRRIDEALPALDEAEVVKAAGLVLFEAETQEAQREGLLALFAAAGSEDAAERLLAACARPDLRREAAASLATVSDPRAMPPLASAAASAGQERDVLEAIADALRNMDTEKARELERRVRSELERR